ncbi:hypothetical protein E2542_SST17603 [Spatholobus suberectus]|nr:hypothetical protein E2542_SST17603 [Spatholobus suberectus]
MLWKRAIRQEAIAVISRAVKWIPACYVGSVRLYVVVYALALILNSKTSFAGKLQKDVITSLIARSIGVYPYL